MPNPLKQCSLNVFKGMKLKKIWFCFQGIPESEEAPLTNISGVGSGAEQAAGGPNASPLDLFPQVRAWYFCGLIKSFVEVEFPFHAAGLLFSQEAVSDAGAGDLGTLEFLRSNDQVVANILIPSFLFLDQVE